MNIRPPATPGASSREPLDSILVSIGKRLGLNKDIRRTDLGFGDLLKHLPTPYATLRAALTELQGREPHPGVHECMEQVLARLKSFRPLPMERQLAFSVRTVLSSETEIEMLKLRMGWTDGRLHSHEDVARTYLSTVDAVHECEARVTEAATHCGLYCPSLLDTIEALRSCPPKETSKIPSFVYMRGISKLRWQASALLETGNLLGIDHGLRTFIMGGKERLGPRPQSVVAAERINSIARALLKSNGEAKIDDIVRFLADSVPAKVRPRDVRLVVAHIEGVEWIDSERSAFRVRERAQPR